MSKTTVVFYHVINDKEDKSSQNVFYISKPINLITLRDVKNEFPLIGTYHFRFKVVHSNTHAWVDINDESSFIPSFNSCIYAKVLRLSWLDRKHEIERDTKRGREIEIERDKEKDKARVERGKETDHSLERIISDHEKIKLHKKEKILDASRGDVGNNGIDNSNSNTNNNNNSNNNNNNNNNSKSKNNIDMLLFETTPHNKHNNANKNKRTENEKDQNYFDLMFN